MASEPEVVVAKDIPPVEFQAPEEGQPDDANLVKVILCSVTQRWNELGLRVLGQGLISGSHYIRPRLGKARALKLQSSASLFSRL